MMAGPPFGFGAKSLQVGLYNLDPEGASTQPKGIYLKLQNPALQCSMVGVLHGLASWDPQR